jgi:hypothetical protein
VAGEGQRTSARAFAERVTGETDVTGRFSQVEQKRGLTGCARSITMPQTPHVEKHFTASCWANGSNATSTTCWKS